MRGAGARDARVDSERLADLHVHRFASTGRALRKFLPVEGFRFSTDLDVRFSETDAQGVVHNAVYLVWFEIARVAYLDQFSGGYKGLVESGVDATTVEAHVRYRAAARFADSIRIHARAGHLRGARFRFEYVLERANGVPGELVADGWTAHACVDARTLRPTRVPTWLAEAIAAVESAEG